MTVPIKVLRAIGEAVRDAGGDMNDVDDLVAVWERLCADRYGRVDRMRREARSVRCCCSSGGAAGTAGTAGTAGAGRCSRCWGWLPEASAVSPVSKYGGAS
jgi:hypothetical protein